MRNNLFDCPYYVSMCKSMACPAFYTVCLPCLFKWLDQLFCCPYGLSDCPRLSILLKLFPLVSKQSIWLYRLSVYLPRYSPCYMDSQPKCIDFAKLEFWKNMELLTEILVFLEPVKTTFSNRDLKLWYFICFFFFFFFFFRSLSKYHAKFWSS